MPVVRHTTSRIGGTAAIWPTLTTTACISALNFAGSLCIQVSIAPQTGGCRSRFSHTTRIKRAVYALPIGSRLGPNEILAPVALALAGIGNGLKKRSASVEMRGTSADLHVTISNSMRTGSQVRGRDRVTMTE
jgi:hypothetical protein